ncbi:transposase-like zinc-binding domain-containing protein [Deinococcus radiopugnans]|uniref:IS1/IS1595 family N-terminal zinc-binding domain-containing protein n=1 Tax=Deinococcus radiopugnans TaxID=57497 RepID=UPI003A955ECC
MNGLKCPQCGGVYIVKNGHAHTGKQRYLCRVCTFQFTLNHARPPISPEKVQLVDRLLSERISHRGICRVVGVSRTWFRHHLQSLAQTVPHRIDPQEVVSSKR